MTDDRLDRQFEQWGKDLLDLSKRNPLINFRSDRALQLVQPEAATLFDGLVNHGKQYRLRIPTDSPEIGALGMNADAVDVAGELAAEQSEETRPTPDTSEPSLAKPLQADELLPAGDPRKINGMLYRLRLRARTAQIEQGINVLFVAFGLLDWRESPESTDRILSPLLLLPVRLERETALSPYTLAPVDDRPILNPALISLFERDFRMHLELLVGADDDLRLEFLLNSLGTRHQLRDHIDGIVKLSAHLGVFSFTKLAMYEDLRSRRTSWKQHPVIRAVAGVDDGLPEFSIDTISERELDERLQPTATYQVLDADASQQKALADIDAGLTLVIQGPPGTGKSQTITNAIAQALAEGKKVLFVSEKIAALEVVAKRLRQVGLHEFVLEAHSQNVDKARVIRELDRTLDQPGPPPAEDDTLTLEQLTLLRSQLNAYVSALHDSDNPLGRSAFWVHGRLAHLEKTSIVPFDLGNIGALTARQIVILESAVQQLARTGSVLLEGQQHPWYGCRIDRFSPQVQTTLDDRLRRLETAARTLEISAASMCSAWNLPAGHSLAHAQWLLDLLAHLDRRPDIPRHWLDNSRLDILKQTARDWSQRCHDYHSRRRALLAMYDERLFAADLPAIQQALGGPDQFPTEFVRGSGPPAERVRALQQRLEKSIPEAIRALRQLAGTISALAETFGLPVRMTLAEGRRLQTVAALVLTDPRPQNTWFDPGRLALLEDLVEQAARQQGIVAELRPRLDQQFAEEFLSLAGSDLGQQFGHAYASPFRWFKPAYHRDLGAIKRLCKAPPWPGYAEAVEALRNAQQLNAAQHWLYSHHVEFAASLGLHYQGARTDWKNASRALHTIHELMACFRGQSLPSKLVDLLHGAYGGPLAIQGSARQLELSIAQVEAVFTVFRELLSLHSVMGNALASDDVPLDRLADWLETWFKWQISFWTAVDVMLQIRRDKHATTAQLLAEIGESLALRVIEANSEAATPELQRQFGRLYAGLNTERTAIQAALDWTSRLHEYLGGPPRQEFIDALLAGIALHAPEREVMTSTATSLTEEIAHLAALFNSEVSLLSVDRLQTMPLVELAEAARTRRQALPRLEEWVDFNYALSEAHGLGLKPYVDVLKRLRLSPDEWMAAFRRQLWSLWLTWWYSQRPALEHFRHGSHEHLVHEFRRLDTAQFQLASHRIAQRLRARRPIIGTHLHPQSEPGILRHEARKQRRFRPLRRLFADLPTLLPVLKPCLLMSPLSVAQYLGESPIEFDLVLFDEASQILPADAIGAIARGKQVVIVGDNKQLPPTRFFASGGQSNNEDAEEEWGDVPPESILDACGARLPEEMLRWHYRSRHEELIACSNRWFYDNRLITFPSPAADVRAVQFVHVPEGVYDRSGTKMNRVEASRLVDLVIEQVKRQPELSLGVITFSEAQMVAVLTEIDSRKRVRPELEILLREDGADGFFVKNLENVQGDQRDVIFFSVGYGPDAAGRMRMNFGPLNQRGGERRLNVAITRARERVVILASFQPQDIDRERAKAEGARLLRQYLEFAVKGPAALLGEITKEGGDPESPFEEAVLAALQARGLPVVTQVGVGGYRIDLAIKDEHSDRYVLGIECDGATYHRTPTARDRDRLRQSVLEGMGWHIHRIWSTDWIKDPAREVERVLAALKAARSAPTIGETALLDPPASPVPESAEASEEMPERTLPKALAPVLRAERYVDAVLPVQGNLDTFRLTRIETLADLVCRCVEAEGPVHEDRVIEAIKRAYDIGHVGKHIRAQILEAVAYTVRRGRIQRRGQFLWPPEMATPPIRGANSAGQRRPIQQVPPEEIEAACLAIVKYNHSLPYPEVLVAVARLLEYDRKGDTIGQTISAFLKSLITRGLLRDLSGQISLDDRLAG